MIFRDSIKRSKLYYSAPLMSHFASSMWLVFCNKMLCIAFSGFEIRPIHVLNPNLGMIFR